MAQTRISKVELGPLHIVDEDVNEITFAVIGASGAVEGQIMQLQDGEWVPVSVAGMSTFVDNETPAGVIDGSNREFELEYMPAPPVSIQLFKGGVLMRQGLANDYVVENQTIIFNTAPQINDVIVAFYRR